MLRHGMIGAVVVTILMLVAAVAVLAGIAVVSTGYGGELAAADPSRPGVSLPPDRPLVSADLERLRFTAGFWGYPTSQVDEVLERVVRALAQRDAHIADLEHRLVATQVTAEGGGDGRGPAHDSGDEEVW